MAFDMDDVGALDIVASIVVAFNVAVAQPLLDAFGRNAEFFVARDSTKGEIIGFALLLTVVVPLTIAVPILVGRRVDIRAGAVMHWVALSALLGALVLLVGPSSGPGLVWVLIALGVGVLGSAAFHRSSTFRGVVRLGLVVPLVVLGLFLFGSPVSKLVLASPANLAAAKPVGDPAPIVMVVFDEFPVASLMDRSGKVDERLFPNFARLADSSTWYRNTTTVAAYTTHAVPAIVDGRYPRLDALPTAGDHPQNLFTLLGRSHAHHVIEPITQLCPEALCPRVGGGSFMARWGSLLRDAMVVAARIVLPGDLAENLPPVGDTWGGFVSDGEPVEDDEGRVQELRRGRGAFAGTIDPRQAFASFVEPLGESRGPSIHFLHALVPHQPWRYLPSGQEYLQTEPLPGGETREWRRDPWLVTQGYQRHLLQVAAVDALIGDLVQTLKRDHLFRRSLVIVTADHGISFRPGFARRAVNPTTLHDIAPVPLFVKKPFQSVGRIDDRPAETIDILPSIADLMQIEGLEKVDGRSLFERGLEKRTHQTIVMGSGDPLTFSNSYEDRMEVVRDKYRIFPATRNGSLDLFGITPIRGDLIGRKLEQLVIGDATGPDAAVDGWDLYDRVDPDDDPFPALLSGSLGPGGTRDQPLAIAVNGRVTAVTRAYDDDGERAFYAMLPPSAFDRPANEVELFAVADRGPGAVLLPIDERSR